MNRELPAGSNLSHYRIVSKIGEGGMGEVWLAEDSRLGRKVALKLLPAEFTEDSERVRRFTQEAKAASALNHPNIISVYDIGECDTGRFIVMEFVAGRTLRSVIAKDNSLETLFTLGAQMARALSAAHAAGITHRDIKPDNIMVRDDGYVKMLDFGLARLLPTTASDPEAMTLAQQTTPGTVMGTLAYMSPEQASGKTAGSASDVFALGIVLYELATGSHPFKSETMIGYLHAITSQVPPPMTSLKSHLPAALNDLILRMLDKNANGRPTASEVVQAMQEIEKYGSSNTLPLRVVAEKPKATRADEGFWVAVLPFKARDADTAVAALADGLSEGIVTGLSRFRYLSVVASASAASLKGETGDERALGAKLGAHYVLEGSIRKGGSGIRVSAQLVDTQTGAQLWAETYNRDLETSSIFAVQDDVAARIVATVADSYGVLVHSMREAIRQKNDADLTTAEWQFQYFAYREQITPSNHAALKSRLERAAKSDNQPSDLWACLAQVYLDEYAFGFPGDDGTSLDRALVAARRAVEWDRANQFAMVALAQTHFFRQDLAAFGPAAERAMALNPLNTDALGILGLEIVHTGQFERGTGIVRHAMELNPNHAGWMHFAPLWNHFHKGEYEQALECANRVDVPGLFWPYLVMASACGHLGRHIEAAAAVRDLLTLDPEFAAHARTNVGAWHFASGLMDPILEGLRKAGLEISDQNEAAAPATDRARSATADSGVARAQEGLWVAVMPFKYGGANADFTVLAEGISEDVITGLSRFSYLRVITHSPTVRYATDSGDVREIGKALGARYVMVGSLRQAGPKLRLAVQLIDATTGAHLWAENYERSFDPDSIFELQDDLVPRIVSTVADQYGALVHSMSESLRGRSAGQYSAHEAVLRSFGYLERVTAEEHAEVRAILEAAVADAPGHSDCQAMLSLIYRQEHADGFNPRPDSLGRAHDAAQRSVAAAPTNPLAHYALATVLFFQKDFRAFRPAAERALALNTMDSSTTAFLGVLIAYSGDWEYGLGLVERAIHLNPHHAGWYHFPAFQYAYHRQDYRGALEIALKINMPGYFFMHTALAAVYAQLGEQERAHAALRKLQALVPDFGVIAREEYSKWLDAELTEEMMDGLRKAGLEISDEEAASTSSARSFVSSETRTDEGFWVAVLPFKFTGSNTEVATLAEGLSEEIVTGLSRFSYLRVISRSSTPRYANETDDVRAVGKALGARYVMEGSLRVAGMSLRISVQLIDASNGAHLWAETYDRQFRAEDVFALQDDLVPRIVSTIADVNGVLPRSMSEVVCSRNPDELSPYEAVLRSFRYFDRVTAEELASARTCLELAVEKAPTHADAWAMLALLSAQDYGQGFNLQSDALTSGILAAQRAVEAGPSNHLAYFSLAQARFFEKDFQSFRNAAERAVALNPMDANSLAFMGELLTYVGDWERGLALASRAKQINPNHPGWFWYADFFHAYRQRDYDGAMTLILKTNLPGHWGMHSAIAAAAGQLGDHAAAAKAIRDLLKLRPDFCTTIHNELKKWFDPELRENLVDGLRKAGLEIPDDKSSSSLFGPQTSPTNSFGSLLKSIAVLPFQNLSADPEQEFFADGITEEILNALAQIKELRVAGRSSSFSFKGRNEDLRSVGAKLNVTSILEGTLRRSSDRLRITAQLIDAVSGYQLWSERYDRVLEDIFDVQDEIALAVVDALKLKLFGDAKEAVVKRYTDDAEVHELFLKGRYYSYKYTAEGWNRAVEFFEKVIEKDPDHAPAYAGKAAALGCLWFFGLSPADDTVRPFRSAATKAIELDGNLAGAHLSLGMVNFFHDWEWEKAEQEFKQAILLNPKDAEALSYYAMFLGFVDRFDEAMALARRALEVDPLSLLINMNVGWTYFSAGLANEAFDQARKMTEIEPAFFGAYWLKGAVCLGNGDYEAAIEQLTKAVSLGGHPIVLADLGAANALAGKQETAEKILDQLLDMRRQSYVPAICLARVYSRLGELKKTIQWLETAFEERNGELVFLDNEITSAAQGDSLNSLGKDPRVKDLLQRMKLPSRDQEKVNEPFS
ncbi:MAG: protein kinase [Acidobacteriota bacterium]